MKNTLCIFFTSTVLVACAQQMNPMSETSAASSSKSYIAQIDSESKESCIADISEINGVSNVHVNEDIVSFTATKKASKSVEKVPCVLSIELDHTVSTQPDPNGNQVKNGYNANIKIGEDQDAATVTQECAKKIKAVNGVVVTKVLEAIGVVSFSADKKQSAAVKKLACVAAVEIDGDVGPLPSTGVGN